MTSITFDTVTGVAGVFVVIALVEGTKRVFPAMSERWFPVCALFFGLLLNAGVALYNRADTGLAVVVGVVVALMASGLYSGTKTVTTGRGTMR